MKEFRLICALILGSLTATIAFAQDQNAARDARKQGTTAPFNEILTAARAALNTRVSLLDAVLHNGQDRVLVEVFFRDGEGHTLAVLVDGADAAVIGIDGAAPSRSPYSRDAGKKTADVSAGNATTSGSGAGDGAEPGGKDHVGTGQNDSKNDSKSGGEHSGRGGGGSDSGKGHGGSDGGKGSSGKGGGNNSGGGNNGGGSRR